MRYFLLVLLITIIAFGDSLLAIALTNPATMLDPDHAGESIDNPDRFTHNLFDSIAYTYRMILGDFDVGGFGKN